MLQQKKKLKKFLRNRCSEEKNSRAFILLLMKIYRGVKMTRKEKFFEIFPEASRYVDDIPNISPCQLDRNFEEDYCGDEACFLCRKKFWNHELDEKDSFMSV